MFPSQTSFIPVQIALIRFFEKGIWRAVFQNYPYWYLGTTPYRYLTGPILPLILSGLHKIFSKTTLFDLMWGVIIFAWIFGGAGVYFLVKALKGKEKETGSDITAIFTVIFYLFGPIVPFLFRFSDGLFLIAFSFVPWVLLLYFKFLERPTKRRKITLIIAITFLFLLDIQIISRLILGMVAVFLTLVGWRGAEKKLRQTFFIFIFSFLFSTLWYSPGYWLTLLKSPSFAGKPAFSVIFWLGKLMPTTFAFIFAIISQKFFKTKNRLRDFCFYWLFIFGFLTLVRFLSDPDFWLDWSTYGTELQIGLAILGGIILEKILQAEKFKILNLRYILKFICVLTIYFFLFAIIFKKYVFNTFQKDITRSVEYQIGKELQKVVKPNETVFLSGSTVFWLNTFFDIPQVRGGKDEASVDPFWRKAVWEVREGENPQDTLKWLRKLEVDYLVVHTKESREFYHDFKEPEKFEKVSGLKKIYDKEGDRIYRVED